MESDVQYVYSKKLRALGVQHGWFMRYGGVSSGLFKSLNGKKGNGDEEGNVDENRTQAMKALTDIADYAHIVHIVHSFKSTILHASKEGEFTGFDASIATSPEFLLSQTTADCGSVIISDTTGKTVALIHGSWHTLKAEIVSKVVQALRQLTDDELIAAIGPMICSHCYEFGPEAEDLFMSKYILPRGEKYLVDLKQMIIDQLRDSGVTQIDDVQICTLEDDRFFSHRRDGAESGRFITLVASS